MSFHYHPGKYNIITDALSKLSTGKSSYVDEEKKGLVKYIQRLTNLGVPFLDSEDREFIIQEVVKLSLSAMMKEEQTLDPILIQIKDDVGR